MKTTLNLNDQVLRQAKQRAARDGITLTRFVEDALRARLAGTGRRRSPFRLQLETVTGDAPPNVDIDDQNALYAVIDRS
ncbi:MAG: CopG family transcriptional regulator [Chloroflexi bacterium]|nr:CopG family transcriptional regulator [Chloroflexota bacterium]